MEIKFIFFGSGTLAELILKELLGLSTKPLALVTLKDKPRGRGRKVKPLPIKEMAESEKIPVLQPESLKSPEFIEKLKSYNPDFIFLADFGKILPVKILEIPKLYPLNFHPSLLPEYRGAAPIERAIMDGKEVIGLTVIIMREKVDAGEIVMQKSIKIGPLETKGEILPRIAKEGAKMLIESAEKLKKAELIPKPQDMKKVSYAPKIKKEETWLNPESTLEKEINRIRALSPKPGVKFKFRGKLIKLLKAKPVQGIPGNYKPGDVILEKDGFFIALKDGLIEVLELIPEGRKRMSADEFLRGLRI